MAMTAPFRTLAGRTVLILLGCTVVALALSFAYHAADRREQWTDARLHYVAERIAGVIRHAEPFPPADRRQSAAFLGGQGFRVAWSLDAVIAEEAEGPDWSSRVFRRMVAEHLGVPADLRLRVGYAESLPAAMAIPARGMGRGMAQMHLQHMGGLPDQALLLASYRMPEGDWLNFAVPALRLEPFWASMPFWGVLLSTLVVTLAAVWAVLHASHPLAVLASAAERLGVDVNAPPVDETGPADVRQAARAFNEMQRRLKGFVEDRTQMLAAISHDLRTPVTRLRLRAEFIDDEELRAKTLADLDEMEAMIAATLSLARDDAINEPRVALDLAALVQTLCDDAADAGRAVSYRGPDHLPFEGRPLALKRAFANLIDNAVKYGAAAAVSLERAKGEVLLAVEDKGPGIPEVELGKVFDPFYRVERSRSRDTGGSGLGLAVVRAAARAHGGDVTLTNRSEGGLKALVRLPVL